MDFSNASTGIRRAALHKELRQLRKVALRLGCLNERLGHWSVRPETLRELLAGVTRQPPRPRQGEGH